ncbi:hypothetical protein CLG96_14670 [Sphingomonas oleivorans]|uniref:Glycerophosphoryl diester phosphodiesterase membrane domain-containing protein n=1 Tax=Sphingomonas oleivorans TaxID=1735121 RepID=A0A2T5FVF3_9SPHN|nr:hypothetical protein [Sphingomonas oleivorans]PTQ09432.1 hypothetical protein CLG96_14670 [Sphingomonas oleivorans]
METVVDYTPRFEFGRVMQRATGAISRNGIAFLVLAAIFAGLPALGLGLLRTEAANAPIILLSGLWGLISSLVSIIASSVLQASIVRATILDLSGGRPRIGPCLRQGVRLILPLVGLSIVFGFGVGVASIAFLIPGLIVATMWSVSVPVLVEEGEGVFASLGRSRELTKGARWQIFGMMLLYGVALLLFGGLQIIISQALNGPELLALLVQAVGSAILALCWSAVTAAIYIELREIKEGSTPDQLAEIFA